MKSKIVLIGGHPKGFDIPFHQKTKSGRIIRKIVNDLNLSPKFFDLWDNQADEDSRVLSEKKKEDLLFFTKNGYKIIALGRYIEKVLLKHNYKCIYLPHPASRDAKYIKALKEGLSKII